MEKTKAQQLIEVAQWVKNQNPEFTKHFKTMRSIIKFYLQLPDGYDRKKSVCEYIRKNLKGDRFYPADRLALIANTLFGFRYFKNAPYKHSLFFGFRSWTDRKGEEHMEVYCDAIDYCSIHNDFKQQEYGRISISIKSRGDARRAADRLLADQIERQGNDYESQYGSRLSELMKQDYPTEEVLTEAIEVRI